MRVDVVIDGDRLLMPAGLRFKAMRTTLTVDIPDALIDEPQPDSLETIGAERANRLLSDIHAILGEGYRYAASGKSDKELLAEALQEKYCR